MNCNIPLFLANFMASYFVASILYLLVTNLANVGTPFKDALKEYPYLVEIKKKSVKRRRNIFILLLLLMVCVFYMFSPFDECIGSEIEDSPDNCGNIQEVFVTQW